MPSKIRGKWRGRVKYQGKQIEKTFLTKREAIEWESNKRKDLKADTQKPLSLTLKGLCVAYLDHTKPRVSKKTYQEKNLFCARFINYLGADTDIENLTRKDVVLYLNKQAKERSNNAHNKDRKNFLALWTYALRIEGVRNNPTLYIDKLSTEPAVQAVATQEEVLRLLTVCTREEKVFLTAYLQTGARRSEIFRLTWAEDINFSERGVRLGTKKTKDGSMRYDWLPMSDELYEQLFWWYKNHPEQGNPYVFYVTDQRSAFYGQPYTTRRKFMPGLCKRANIRKLGFHALRRYVASVLADEHKVSAKTIQRLLRHQSETTTERYIKKINNDLESTVNLLSNDNKKSEKGVQAGGAK